MSTEVARLTWPEPDDIGRRGELVALRASWWAFRAYRRVRRDLAASGLAARVAPPPRLPRRAGRGVQAVLRRQPATCLERCLVLQRWLASQGEPYEVVIGVAGEEGAFKGHAWLPFEAAEAVNAAYTELHRIPPVGEGG